MTTTQEQFENAVNWIDELLDTDYKQLTEELGDIEVGFCCLGVANHSLDLNEQDVGALCSTYSKLGLRGQAGEFYNGNYPTKLKGTESDCLASLNDNEGYTFKQLGQLCMDYPQHIFQSKVAKLLMEYYSTH